MKKTLITLAATAVAVASVAQAAVTTFEDIKDNLTLEAWDVPASAHYSGTYCDTTTKAFTLTFAIDWNAAVSNVPTVDNKTLVQVGTSSNYWQSAVDLAVSGTTITTSVRVDNSGTWQTQGSLSFDKENYCVDGLLKLSFSFNGSDTYTLSAMKNDAAGTITSQEIANFMTWNITQNYGNIYIGTGISGDVVDSLLGFNKVLDEGELRAASRCIPEPATATLSLLALAGLAARRRRK